MSCQAGEVDGILAQVARRRSAEGEVRILPCNVKRSFHLQSGLAEAVEPMARTNVSGPKLSRARGQYPDRSSVLSSVLAHIA